MDHLPDDDDDDVHGGDDVPFRRPLRIDLCLVSLEASLGLAWIDAFVADQFRCFLPLL